MLEFFHFTILLVVRESAKKLTAFDMLTLDRTVTYALGEKPWDH